MRRFQPCLHLIAHQHSVHLYLSLPRQLQHRRLIAAFNSGHIDIADCRISIVFQFHLPTRMVPASHGAGPSTPHRHVPTFVLRAPTKYATRDCPSPLPSNCCASCGTGSSKKTRKITAPPCCRRSTSIAAPPCLLAVALSITTCTRCTFFVSVEAFSHPA